MLEVYQLDFFYGKKQVLHQIDLQAQPGEVISLLGPNGSGKSTLLRNLAGLLKPDAGTITLRGDPLEKLGRREIARQLSFLPQGQEPVQHMNVWELVARGRSPHQRAGWMMNSQDRETVQWALDYMALSHLAHRNVADLSGGERQRAWIAMVLAQDTQLVLLDEPVTYLDIKHQWDVLEVIQDLKESFHKTIITVFHDLNHAMAVSDRVYLLRQGEVFAQGPPETVITHSAMHDAYGIHAQVCRVQHCCHPVVVPAGIKPGKCRRNKAAG